MGIMSTPKFPIGKAPACGIDEYIGTDFDIVKEVADNLDVIKQAASLIGPDVTSLFTNILAKLGHNVVGSFEKGVTLTAPNQYVTYADNVYHYTGDVYPYVIEPDTKPNSDFALGYRGSVVDWDAFDRALLDWADIAYKGIPDTIDKSLRVEALDKLGLSRYWKPGDTITKVGTLVRFGDIEYQAINVPAVMGATPEGDIKFRRWTVTPDDVVPGILDQLTQLRDEAIVAAETSTAQAVSSAGSATMAKDASVVATTAATSASASADAADTSASAAILASNEAKLAANTAKEAESVVVAAEQSVSVKYDDIVLKHADVVTKHADVVALAATVGSHAVAAGEAAINAQQAADKAKASEQFVANNASAAQQAQVQAANSAANAALSAKGAVTSATEAANMANAAKTSAASAKTYATNAGTAASSAIAAANSVEGSEAATAASAAAAAQSVILTDTAKTEAVNAAVEARNASESATRSASAANISAVNADNAAKSVQGIADAVLPSVEEAKGYAASAKADATIATENAVIAGNHAVTANNSIAISTAKATEALQSANTAAVSATTAVDAKDRCEEIYTSIHSGVVVRGSWDVCTDAYPTDKSATARWDVIVTRGDSHVFDGKEFRNGDILYYDLGTDTFYHTPVQGVGGVASVNGKTGTDIVLTPADIGSLPATGKAVNSSLLDGFTKEDIVTESRTGLVDTVTLNTALGTKLDKTATAVNSLKLEGFTKAQIIAEAQDGMAGSDVFYTKEESNARYPLVADVVKKSGSVMTGQLTVPNLVVSAGLVNLTNGRLQFDSAGNTRIVSKSNAEFGLYGSGLNPTYRTPDGVYYKLYHEGYLPTLEALGAFPAVGGDMDGEIIFKPTKSGDAVKNGIYFGANTTTNLAFWGDALAVYLGSSTKEVSMSGTNLKFNGKSVYYVGNEPTPAAIGALPSTGKAADSSLLDGKTKNEVIAEARTGLLTANAVYTKTESDTRYPTIVAADAKYYSNSNKPSPATLGAAPASHTHTWAQVTGAPVYTTRWPTWGEVSGKPATYAPSAHTHDDRYNVTHKFNAVVRQGVWSRIAGTNVGRILGGTYLLAINHTRDNVVVNALFLVTSNHSNSVRISQLSSGNYTQIQVRLTSTSVNDVYIEVLDTAVGTGDNIYSIRLECISAGSAIPYTSFTAGGGTVRASIQTAFTDFIGNGSGLTTLNASNLSGGVVPNACLPTTATRWPTFAEVTGKPTTFAPSAHDHSWSNITSGVPATATRWPTFAEVSGKPTNYPTTWESVAAKPATATRWPTLAEIGAQPAGSYAASSHTHPWSQVTGVPATATRWPTFDEVSGKPVYYPPTNHIHSWGEISGKPSKPTVTKTTLYSGNIAYSGSTVYTLAKAWDQFDAIVVIGSHDGGNSPVSSMKTREELQEMYALAGTTKQWELLASSEIYIFWQMVDTSMTKFKITRENGVLYKIIGINYSL